MHNPEDGLYLTPEQHALESKWLDLMDANFELAVQAELEDDEELWEDLHILNEDITELERQMYAAGMVI